MAYLVKLTPRRCYQCEARATVEIRNHYNAHVGDYCRRHGDQKLREVQERELIRPLSQKPQP